MNIALIVRLIYKNKENRTEFTHWRPISLLTVDYKILSKVITNRIKSILCTIIGDEQTSGVANIISKIILMILSDHDTLDYINMEQLWGSCY